MQKNDLLWVCCEKLWKGFIKPALYQAHILDDPRQLHDFEMSGTPPVTPSRRQSFKRVKAVNWLGYLSCDMVYCTPGKNTKFEIETMPVSDMLDTPGQNIQV